MCTLSLTLLGATSITFGDRQITTFRTRAAQALLIYLVCQPEAHARESLMAMFWPDVEHQAAQANLRQALYLLRQEIPPLPISSGGEPVLIILADRRTIQLNPEAPVESDAAAFKQLLDGPKADWSKAVDLYQGEFLADFYLADSSPFESWVSARRTALRRQACSAMSQLADEALANADYAAAEQYARQQLAQNDLRESAHRQLMEALAMANRRRAAVAQFESCRALLAKELQIEPSPATISLNNRIRSGELAARARLVSRGYFIERSIEIGTLGPIYKAVQTGVGREVALKIVSGNIIAQPDFLSKFELAARQAAQLEHPHIVPLYDFWLDANGAYLVSRWLRGGSLADAIQRGPLDLCHIMTIVEQAASALSEAHKQGVVHGAVKPSNILFDQSGNAYLSDFCNLQASLGSGPDDLALLSSDLRHLSPQQAMGMDATPQDDLYSLGLVLFQMITGQYPWPEEAAASLIQRSSYPELPPLFPYRPDISPAVDGILHKATARPAEQYASVSLFAVSVYEALRSGC